MRLYNVIENNQTKKFALTGIETSAKNIGNRTVNLDYIGFVIKINGEFIKFYPYYKDFNCKAMLCPTQRYSVEFTIYDIEWDFAKLEKIRNYLYMLQIARVENISMEWERLENC